MRKVVVSQSMYFPWIGLLEQVRLANVYISYDDVQYARGFYNRVQIKSPRGVAWLTIPLSQLHQGQKINEVKIDESQDWRNAHLRLFQENYKNTPYVADAIAIMESVFALKAERLADVSRNSILALVKYFEIGNEVEFLDSAELNVGGSSSQRLNDLVMKVHGTHYVTGHGALNYLDYQIFENNKINVEYIDYKKTPYQQIHGDFTPYVSSLDLVANVGKAGRELMASPSVYWRDFILKNQQQKS